MKKTLFLICCSLILGLGISTISLSSKNDITISLRSIMKKAKADGESASGKVCVICTSCLYSTCSYNLDGANIDEKDKAYVAVIICG